MHRASMAVFLEAPGHSLKPLHWSMCCWVSLGIQSWDFSSMLGKTHLNPQNKAGSSLAKTNCKFCKLLLQHEVGNIFFLHIILKELQLLQPQYDEYNKANSTHKHPSIERNTGAFILTRHLLHSTCLDHIFLTIEELFPKNVTLPCK